MLNNKHSQYNQRSQHTYKSLIRYIDELISYKAEVTSSGHYALQICDLEEQDLAKLTSLFIECDNRDVVAETCLQNAEQSAMDDDVTCALVKLLNDVSLDNKENLADVIIKQSIKSYSDRIQQLITDRCRERFVDEMYEDGCVPMQDLINGESRWVRTTGTGTVTITGTSTVTGTTI